MNFSKVVSIISFVDRLDVEGFKNTNLFRRVFSRVLSQE